MTDKTVFSAEQWDLLTRLPRWVVAAASAAQTDGALGTAAEKEVGYVAIAWGREAGNPFVAAIAEQLTFADGEDEGLAAAPDFTDVAAGLASVLESARTASGLLGEKADAADASAYRTWLLTIADQVISAARSGGVLGFANRVSDAEGQFRDNLARVVQA